MDTPFDILPFLLRRTSLNFKGLLDPYSQLFLLSYAKTSGNQNPDQNSSYSLNFVDVWK